MCRRGSRHVIRHMRLFIATITLAVAALALAQAPKTGKLTGHLDVGPLSPVERPGVKPKVPPEVYKRYTIMVTQHGPQNGHVKSHLIRVVKQLPVSAKGDFSVDLAPGVYQVGVSPTDHMLRTPPAKEVTIVAGKTVKVDLYVDTGIR